MHARVTDVAELLDEKLVARSAKDLISKSTTILKKTRSRRSSPRRSNRSSPTRGDRCPVEQRAAAYCRRVEALCSELNVGTSPRTSPR